VIVGVQTFFSFAGAGLQPAPSLSLDKKIEGEETFRTGLQTPSSTKVSIYLFKIK